MMVLIASGSKASQYWRKTLPVDQELTLGRDAENWSVPWDRKISGRHLECTWVEAEGVLKARRLPSTKNPIYVRGEAADEFEITPGERFVIGETLFLLSKGVESGLALTPPSTWHSEMSSRWQTNRSSMEFRTTEEESSAEIAGMTLGYEELRGIRFSNPDHRIDALSRLPEAIASAADDQQLADRLIDVLLAGASRADFGALISADEVSKRIKVIQWQERNPRSVAGRFQPSQRLVLQSVDQKQSVYHSWRSSDSGEGARGALFTITEGQNWAFSVPVQDPSGNWKCLYAAGRTDETRDEQEIREDLKFAGLVASTFGALMDVKGLQHRQALLGQCFSPTLLKALEGRDPEEVLKPRVADITVLFCDLRGFTREAERNADNLFDLLERIGQALGVMTEHILKEGGVIGDFQGDAAMGFWGWPFARADAVAQACRAAMAIREGFAASARQPDHPLHGFKVGIGIATGRAVAGRIGTADQAKFSVFGPVVNLASRLEGLTKVFRAPILLDEATANLARSQIAPQHARFRRLARVIPFGMKTPLVLTQLLPGGFDHHYLSDHHISIYEAGLDKLSEGDWREAYRLFSLIPQEDQAKDFLTGLILSHYREAPENWEGVIVMKSK